MVSTCAVAAIAVAAGSVFAGSVEAKVHRHTSRQSKRQAEVTLLHATKALKRLDSNLIDPHTHLVHTNTRAVCTGIGKPVKHRFNTFRCLISYKRRRILVGYVALGPDGASLKKLASYRR